MLEVVNKPKQKFNYLVITSCFLLLAFTFDSKTSTEIPSGMVMVPGGEHTPFYGNEGDTTVRISPFLLDKYAVTNAEFLEFVIANPKWSKSKIPGIYGDTGYLKHWESDFKVGDNYDQIKDSPVTNVSWYAANAYSKWKGKRLPTITEWEYAGSAKIPNDNSDLEKIILSWYSKPTPSVLPPVGSTFMNEFQLYDMHGLIWEWVYDFNSIIMGGDSRSNSAIKRELFCASGSFGAVNKEDYAAFMRFAYRGSLKANYTVSNLGFRCAMSL